ncbi:MAG: galactose ABC transporter substrate-binding protein [Lachnospiraceae bacterium]|nr:galactose ABC transporter substrate-binding protein [Lachnospiraceae bacterium]
MKKKGKTLVALILIFFISLSTVSCKNGDYKDKKTIKIGVLCYDERDTFLRELFSCLKEDFSKYESDDLKISLNILGSNNSQRLQNEQAEEMMDDGVDVLCVNLVDRTAPSKIIDKARSKDIPIVFFNRELVDEDLMQWSKLYYVGANAKMSGNLQGKLASDAIKNNPSIDKNLDGKIQYVVMQGQPGHQDSIIRTENSVSKILDSGIKLEKIGTSIANWNRSSAETKMKEYIDQYGSDIELVLCNNDDMALGVIDAYNRSDITESSRPLVFGVDGNEVALSAVINGDLSGTVYNDKESQAEGISKLAMKLAKNENLTDLNLIKGKYLIYGYYPITKDNVEKYLKR